MFEFLRVNFHRRGLAAEAFLATEDGGLTPELHKHLATEDDDTKKFLIRIFKLGRKSRLGRYFLAVEGSFLKGRRTMMFFRTMQRLFKMSL